MVRPAYRLGCRLQICSFPLSAEAIALLRAEAKFPVVGQAIQDRCGGHLVATDAPPSPWMLGRRWAVQEQNNAHDVGKDRQRQDDRRERLASRPDVRAEGERRLRGGSGAVMPAARTQGGPVILQDNLPVRDQVTAQVVDLEGSADQPRGPQA